MNFPVKVHGQVHWFIDWVANGIIKPLVIWKNFTNIICRQIYFKVET